MTFVIAVDGPAASGKGTVASALARHYGLPYLDTGLLYRTVGVETVLALNEGLHHPDARTTATRLSAHIDHTRLDHPRLTTRVAGELASQVAAWPEVRANLLDFQRRFSSQEPGAVLDGRDIGTVIVPEASAKLFVTASPRVRAHRRWKQLRAAGELVEPEEILEDIQRRDERDSGRAAAPLVMASDAALLDTSEMTIDDAFREALRLVELARGP